jgi:hypothetical protein
MVMMTMIAENNVHWKVSANMAVNFGLHNNREFLYKLNRYDIVKKYPTL